MSSQLLMDGRLDASLDSDLVNDLAKSMNIVLEDREDEKKIKEKEKDVCKIACLLIINACLLHKRLLTVPFWSNELLHMLDITGSKNPKQLLRESWEKILSKDYKPVFNPPLSLLKALPDRPFVNHLLSEMAECAHTVADQLTDLGYDHAGPLYHKILPNAESTGAFYTNNISALLLAKLALKSFVDYSDDRSIKRLRVMDPACGTGTLLMASVKTIKDFYIHENRLSLKNEDHRKKISTLHRLLVENVVYGLDINQCAVQLAASNLTLGAPSVDYRSINLFTMHHGLQPDSSIKAGSLEILNYADEKSLQSLVYSVKPTAGVDSVQVNEGDTIFPIKDVDVIIMNPPFTNNTKRSSKYSEDTKKMMQQHEQFIRDGVLHGDREAGRVINFNSIESFFAPLADKLLNEASGVLAKVMPATACTGASALQKRIFLAERFHIEKIITSHDPQNPNFSENTSIHECLMVARRYNNDNKDKPTEFIALKKMPKSTQECRLHNSLYR